MTGLSLRGLTVERARMWLPQIAAFLCLSILAMATVALFDVNAEPKSPASGKVTSIGAQGFAGLRRLLEARGAVVKLNRFEDGSKDVDRGDLEIITLDDDGGVFSGDVDHGVKARSQGSASESASDDGASASGDASASSRDDAEARRHLRRLLSGGADGDDGYAVPDTRRVNHVLYHPLGRAVLVVAPKWSVSAATGPQARWGQGADVLEAGDVSNILAVLAPVTWKAIPVPPTPKVPAPKVRVQNNDGDNDSADAPTAVLDRVPYVVTRAKAPADLVLSPAPGQGVVTTPVRTGRIAQLQSVTGPNLTPVLTGPNGEVLLSRVVVAGNRPQTAVPVYLLSDPDLLDNQVLADPARTLAALDLVKALTPQAVKAGKPVYVFNLTFNALGFDHDLLHALSRPPYIAVPLSLLIAALGLMWAAFARFGPPKREDVRPALGRGVRILADNAARLMAVTLKETKLGPAYAQLMRDQVLKIRGYRQIDARESADDLADRISQIYKATHTYSDLRAQATRVVTVHQLIDVALRLHAWKIQISQTDIGQNATSKTESHLANR